MNPFLNIYNLLVEKKKEKKYANVKPYQATPFVIVTWVILELQEDAEFWKDTQLAQWIQEAIDNIKQSKTSSSKALKIKLEEILDYLE